MSYFTIEEERTGNREQKTGIENRESSQADKTLVALGAGPSEVRRLLRLLYAALAACEAAALSADETAILPAWSIAAASIFQRTAEIFA